MADTGAPDYSGNTAGEVAVMEFGAPCHSVRVATVPKPAAGAAWSWSSSRRVRVLAVSGKLTASAVVATRYPTCKLTTPNGTVIATVVCAQGTAAGAVGTYSFIAGAAGTGAGSHGVGPLPALILPPNATVTIDADSVDAGDQWDNCSVAYVPIED